MRSSATFTTLRLKKDWGKILFIGILISHLMNKNDLKTISSVILCLVLLGLASALREIRISFGPGAPKKEIVVEQPTRLTYVPQFVLISYDGSKAIDLWRDLHTFKEELKGQGKNIKYTFFINTAYFLTEDTRKFYLPPREVPGHTNIGISEGVEDIRERIQEINTAVASGDEIAPHTTGHHSGLGWSKEEWETEMSSFDGILFGLDDLYPDANLPKLNLKPQDIIGFRAPYLDKSDGLYEMLHANRRYRYDTSEIGTKDAWPTKDEMGLWHIPLGILFIGPQKTPVLAMDYNLYVRDSSAKDKLKKGTDAWNRAHDEILAAWLEYFNRNYEKNRAPVLMGYHYGQWNDGLYWEVMKEFAREVCGKPQVNCGTFRDLVNYMEEYGVPKSE
jgi:hypothetical protein